MDVLFKRYFWVVHLTVIGVCAGFTGRALSHVVEGAYLVGSSATTAPAMRRPTLSTSTAKTHGKETDEIIRRNIFCSGCVPVVPVAAAEGSGSSGSGDPVKSTLSLELVSTMVCPDDENWSVAIIRDVSTKDKDPGMYSKGSKIGQTGAEVFKVIERRVYLKNSGRMEYIELDASPSQATVATAPTPVGGGVDPNQGDIDANGINCHGNGCTIERAVVEKLLGNTAQLAVAARFVPSIKDGKPNGFKLYAIRPNSIFGRIGLQNGDTIKTINGSEMTTPDQALGLYAKLRNASRLSVQVERRNETVSYDYTIR